MVRALGVPNVQVTSLKVQVKVSDDWLSGTDDTIYIYFNQPYPSPSQGQLLLSKPSKGESKTLVIDLSVAFPNQQVRLQDLHKVGLYQDHDRDTLASSWKLESLILIVNDHYYNYAFQPVNEWIDNRDSSSNMTWLATIPNNWGDVRSAMRRSWMLAAYDVIKDKTLRQLAIPGTHDAGMYVGGVSSLGKTQDLTIYQQLVEGVRYFDLRPDWYTMTLLDGTRVSELRLYHGPVGGPLLDDVLADVVKFMSEPGRELVILKFSHFSGFNDAIYCGMVEKICTELDTWLCKATAGKRLADTPMKNFIETGGAVMVVCDEAYPVNNPTDRIYTYRDWDSVDPKNGQLTVYDRYSNMTTAATMTADQTAKFSAFDGKCSRDTNVQCDLFLLSWTLTPVTAVWDYAKQVNPILNSSVQAMANPNAHGQRLNILYVDYVEYADATGTCLALNCDPGNGTYEIQVVADCYHLHANDLGDKLVSTRYQNIDDDYTRFILERQDDGTYRIKVKADNLYWHANDEGDKLVSTRAQTNDDYTRFRFVYSLEKQAYRIYVLADDRYLHANDLEDKLVSTRGQLDDDYTYFHLLRH
jgi:hypothetical protein